MSTEVKRLGSTDYLKSRLRAFVSEWMILFLFLALFILCSLFIRNFFELGNLMNIARQVSFLTIAALGQFFVILIAHMDLSVGSSIGLSSALLAGLVSFQHLPFGLSLFIVILVSVIIGLINGAVVIYGRVPAFIATLVMMNVLTGISFLYSKGLPISGLPKWFSYFGMGYFLGIPVPVYMMVICAAFCYVLTTRTALGRNFYAVGGNFEAAKLSGVNVVMVGMVAFVLCSIFTLIASLGLTSRTMSGSATLGDAMLFDIITVVVLGGTSLFGGRGNILGVVIAALLIGIITNAMVLLGINTYFQWIIKGLILIAVVLADVNAKRNKV